VSCVEEGEKEIPKQEIRTEKDLERAIEAIEDRRAAELRIIDEQTNMIEKLEENRAAANSEGMKAKIDRDILMKEVVLEKARGNLANQDSILSELYNRRESLIEDK
jgi:hypothetical protein